MAEILIKDNLSKQSVGVRKSKKETINQSGRR